MDEHIAGNGHAGASPHHVEGEEQLTVALQRLLQHIEEGIAYASYYMSVRADQARAGMKSAVLMAGLGVVGFIAGAAVLWTSARLLVTGIAEGLAALFGAAWAGNLLTGLLLLALIGGGGWFAVQRTKRSLSSRTQEKYERLKHVQREKFGRSVEETALRAGVPAGDGKAGRA